MNGAANVDGEMIFEECSELLSGLQGDLSGLKSSRPGQMTRVRMQRSAHTAKGLIGFLGIKEMDRLAVDIEEVLRRFRDDESVAPMPQTIDGIVSDVEELVALLERLSSTQDAGVSEDSSSTDVVDPAADEQMKALSGAVVEVLGGFGLGEVTCSEGTQVRGELKTTTDLTIIADLTGDLNASAVLALDSAAARNITKKMAEFMYGADHAIDESESEELVRGALGEIVNYITLAMLSKLGAPPEVGTPAFVSEKGVHLAILKGVMLNANVHTELGDFVIGLVQDISLSKRLSSSSDVTADAPQSRGKVVIVDDSLVMRKTIEHILIQAGFTVVAHAANGQEAVEEFRRHRPDLVTMDINMPVMSGLDALRIIRAEDPTARVLMCSAIAENGIIRRGLNSGAVGYITKPFKPETVLDAVEYLLVQTAKPKKKTEGFASSTVPTTLGIYRVDDALGEGGMAVVYAGFDPGLGRKVAIKVMADKHAADVGLVVRFLEEARAVARVSHPNVVSVYAAGSDNGKHYFAMELLPGPDLEELVYRKGPLTPRNALAYIRQAATGLAAAAEKGLIHCDVKPSNFVFGDDGMVKVTDFGIAQKVGTEDAPTISEMVGTPCFMSPEQVQEHAIDHRADIYSLGATLYYLLTGDPPYDGEDGVEVALRQVHDPVPQIPKAPRKLNRLLAKMMAKSPDARYATYAELIAAIDNLL